jgi:hypothetical protein
VGVGVIFDPAAFGGGSGFWLTCPEPAPLPSLDGHNVADFLDLDILERCEELEREEGLRFQEQAAQDAFEIDGHELTTVQCEIWAQIRKKKALLIQEHGTKKRMAESRPIVPRILVQPWTELVADQGVANVKGH